jgi:hypothetical protein
MKKRFVRYSIFAALMLVVASGPSVPRGVRAPRGFGCSGGARVAPKIPVAGPRIPTKAVPVAIPRPQFRVPPSKPPAGVAAREVFALGLAAKALHPEAPGVLARPLEALGANKSSLEALGGLRDLVHSPWPEKVPVEKVESGLAAFAQTASAQDAATMRRYVAWRAELEGQPDVSRQFLPPGESRDARNLLRDLKAMEGYSGTPPPSSPLVEVPLPEPEPLGLKAPVREAIDKDLPGVGNELPAAELRARRGALRAIETSAADQFHHFHVHLHNLTSLATSNKPDDREDEVERELGRLTPEERLLVRRLLRTKKTPEVVAALSSMTRN